MAQSFVEAECNVVLFGGERPSDGRPLYWHVDVM